MIKKNLFTSSMAVMAVVATSAVVYAHAVVNESELPAGTLQFITVRITHGCGALPVKQVRVAIPEGVIRVSPRYTPGWEVTKKMRKLDKPFAGEGGQMIMETVSELTWTGGPLPDGYYGEFQIRAMLPNEPGRTLYFKTIQTCEKGEIRWIEEPKAGQDPMSLKEPSPFVKLVAAPPGKK